MPEVVTVVVVSELPLVVDVVVDSPVVVVPDVDVVVSLPELDVSVISLVSKYTTLKIFAPPAAAKRSRPTAVAAASTTFTE